MANPAKDLIGQRFGYLTVISRAGTTVGTVTQCALWLCKCKCGAEVVRRSQYLRSKHRTHPRSCGCHHGNETHKMANSSAFNIWSKMKQRCTRQRDKDWRNYGGRGITVCDRWLAAFELFWEDMGPSYIPGLTLDRIDNAKGYSQENCRWATVATQANNRRTNNRVVTPAGEMTAAQAADHYGINRVTFYARIGRYKWAVEKACLTPTQFQCTTSSTAAQGTGS